MTFDKTKLNKSGVYKITNKVNGKFYIGSATNFYHRFYTHLWGLNNNKHYNKYLQKSWNKYGESSFKFEALATCPQEYLLKLEQWFIDNLKPSYNLSKIAGSMKGHVKSEEAKLKQRLKILGTKQTKEHIQKRFENRVFIITDEIRKNMSLAHKGKKRSKQSIEKQILKRSKKIDQYTANGKFIKTWISAAEIKKVYNITNLNFKIKRGKHLMKGYLWYYHKDQKEGFIVPEPIEFKKKQLSLITESI